MNTKPLLLSLLIAGTAILAPASAATSDEAASSLTSQQARNMAAAAELAAMAQGHAIVISIIDNHGKPKYFHRMDGADKTSIKLAQLKAETSARFPLASPTSGEHRPAHPAKPYASLPGLTLLEGGLPIMDKNGMHIGGIGISGATPELDAQFTRVALEELGGESTL
ncbi:GlcG/HbpS family heme-binding protein [Pseudomonas juntendi]|uniref:GlcG/HbpS family heme-binding protein n=1 Tax=Pseudomonas juntendi TaxID=2666183 RepID=UPI001B825B70|nr:heme-binding protein [Pseudomonas juntendi]MBR7520207.1 heme-binding protein [Pseudomonas juntendi]